jgi:hypothetical protein
MGQVYEKIWNTCTDVSSSKQATPLICSKAPKLTLEQLHSGYLGRLGKQQLHENCELRQFVLDPGYHSSQDTREDKSKVRKEFKK